MQTSRLLLFDATSLEVKNPTGVEQYALQLLPHLTRALQAEKWLVGWIGHSQQSPDILPEGAHWYSSPYHRLWSQTALPNLLESLRPALYYTPSFIPPLRAQCSTACTVHDLGVYHQPQSYSLVDRFRMRSLSKKAVRKASLIIVPTNYVAQDVQRYWHIEQSRIVVAGEGHVTTQKSAEPMSVVAPFLLYVGRLEQKKNLVTLLQGFEKLLLNRECQLVLAGNDGVGARVIKKYISKLPEQTRQRILLPGYVSDAQKCWLYQCAVAGVVPCPYEGFGLPMLDCFAAKIPAICAKAGALPEVGGNACQYVEYDSPTDWYLQMQSVLDDALLRKQLTAAGTDRLKDFSWEKSAAKIASALAKAATVEP